MNIRLLTIILFIIPSLSFGQYYSKDFDFNTGEAYPVVDAQNKFYFSNGDEILMIKKTDKQIIIQKYDVLEKKETKHKVLPPLEKGAVFDEIVQLQGNYYLFYSLWDKKNTLEQLYYMPIDFDKGSFGTKHRLIKHSGKLAGTFGAVKDRPTVSVVGFGYGRMGVTNKFKFSKSYDESKLVIQYRKKPTTRKDKESFDVIGMYVFDPELNEIWSDEFKMPYSEAGMNNIDFDVDGQGNAYMLTEVFESDEPRRYIKDKKNYHLELIKISDSGVELIELKEDDKFINSIWMFEASNSKMYLAGYYNEEPGYYKSVEGVYVMNLDDDGSISNSSYHKIPTEIINQYKSARTQKKNDKKEAKGKLDFEHLVLDKILIGDDGSTTLIGEQYYVTSSTDSKGRTTYYYHYNDILVTKIDKDGNMEWMKKLPKKQKGVNTSTGLSYKHIYENGSHYFFFLDHIENIDLDVNDVPRQHMAGRGGIFTSYELSDADGSSEKASIVNVKEVKMKGFDKPMPIYQFSVNRIIETSQGIVFEAYKKGKQDVMVHVEFE